MLVHQSRGAVGLAALTDRTRQMAAEFSHVGVVTLCAEDDGGYSLRNNLTGESAAVPLRGVCELVVAASTTSNVINDNDECAWNNDIYEFKVVVFGGQPEVVRGRRGWGGANIVRAHGSE